MAIKKQEFYEGAALHLLARTGRITSICYEAPFFLLNQHLLALLKYSTKGRSPWGFTFTPDEQEILRARASDSTIIVALICGSDGIAAFSYDNYMQMVVPRDAAVHIACYRQHGEHYEVYGPDGRINGKISPSNWKRILGPWGEVNDESL
jgi:hypothetical protein